MFSKKSGEHQTPPSPNNQGRNVASRGGSTFSVLGADLTIKGDITASVDLHIDGQVEGDIACSSLVQGKAA